MVERVRQLIPKTAAGRATTAAGILAGVGFLALLVKLNHDASVLDRNFMKRYQHNDSAGSQTCEDYEAE